MTGTSHHVLDGLFGLVLTLEGAQSDGLDPVLPHDVLQERRRDSILYGKSIRYLQNIENLEIQELPFGKIFEKLFGPDARLNDEGAGNERKGSKVFYCIPQCERIEFEIASCKITSVSSQSRLKALIENAWRQLRELR